MDQQVADGEEHRREEEEVEFILGALPSIWHNTQNVLRDLGYHTPADVQDNDQQAALRHRASGSSSKHTESSPEPPSEQNDQAAEKVCRMCFSSEHELGDDGLSLGRLIAPCHCDGSMRYVHDTCLDQWRRKSAASEAARICGQCHASYRFRHSPYSNLMTFIQASQLLRVLACVLLVFLLSVVLGLLGFLVLRTMAKLEGTPLGFVRESALRHVKVQEIDWNITLRPDEARAVVWMPASVWHHNGAASAPRIDQETYLRADLEVFSRVRQQMMDNPVYWKPVSRELSSYRANFSEARIVRSKLRAGEDVSWELERLSSGLPLFPLPEARSPERNISKQHAKSNMDAGVQVNTHKPIDGLQTPFKLLPSLRERLAGSFALPFLSPPKDRGADATNNTRQVEIWQRQNMTIWFEYEETPMDMYPNPSEHFLVRWLPEWLGFMRYVVYGFVLAMVDRFFFVASVFQPWWSSMSRSALQLALLLFESHRELLWCATKAAVAALLAYIDVKFEPVKWNPGNATVIGPARTSRRKAAAVVRELIVGVADSVFGPLWLNWWGGYSLSVYLSPRDFMTTERVEMTQLASVFAPAITLLIDVAFSGLGTFSDRAARFQKSHTSRWTQADWVHNEFSASDGYRRMIATLLGDKEATKASLLDLWLEVEGKRLLPGRTRPMQMALMPKLSTWKTVMLLGCLLTTATALVIATKLAWDTTISHFARQAWRSMVSIYHLLLNSGDSFRFMWRQTRDVLVFIARYTSRKAKTTAMQLIRSTSRAILGDRGTTQDLASTSEETSTRQRPEDDTAAAAAAADADADAGTHGAEQQAEGDAAEPVADPLLNDPFVQGAQMGIYGAILGHVASIYGCIHAFVFTMRFILVYLPFEPFMIVYTLLQKLIQFDVASAEVLDREDVET